MQRRNFLRLLGAGAVASALPKPAPPSVVASPAAAMKRMQFSSLAPIQEMCASTSVCIIEGSAVYGWCPELRAIEEAQQ